MQNHIHSHEFFPETCNKAYQLQTNTHKHIPHIPHYEVVVGFLHCDRDGFESDFSNCAATLNCPRKRQWKTTPLISALGGAKVNWTCLRSAENQYIIIIVCEKEYQRFATTENHADMLSCLCQQEGKFSTEGYSQLKLPFGLRNLPRHLR